MSQPKGRRSGRPAGWEPVAEWYDSWMGAEGGDHHRNIAIPTVLELAQIRPREKILDIGAGQGVLAPAVNQAEGIYTGIDVSERLLSIARKRHGQQGRFLLGDARKLD